MPTVTFEKSVEVEMEVDMDEIVEEIDIDDFIQAYGEEAVLDSMGLESAITHWSFDEVMDGMMANHDEFIEKFGAMFKDLAALQEFYHKLSKVVIRRLVPDELRGHLLRDTPTTWTPK